MLPERSIKKIYSFFIFLSTSVGGGGGVGIESNTAGGPKSKNRLILKNKIQNLNIKTEKVPGEEDIHAMLSKADFKKIFNMKLSLSVWPKKNI
jgi:hypothetical protein